MRPSRRFWFGAFAFALGFAVFAATSEWAVRAFRIMPRAQIIRGGDVRGPGVTPIDWSGTQPTWEMSNTVARQNLACIAEQERRVVMVGSSVFYGSGYEPPEVMSTFLGDRLASDGEQWCVYNLAQPAYISGNKMEMLRRHLPEIKPAVVLWEVWMNDPGGYSRVGDDAINLTGLLLDSSGTPSMWPVPSAANQALFRVSRAWQLLALGLSVDAEAAYERRWEALIDGPLPELVGLCEQHGCTVGLVMTPGLDTPFEAWHARPPRAYEMVAAWADRNGIAKVSLAEGLIGLTPEEVRHDPCCHYNPRGHQNVADLLEPFTRGLARTGN